MSKTAEKKAARKARQLNRKHRNAIAVQVTHHLLAGKPTKSLASLLAKFKATLKQEAK